jgi:hypothetical protein
MAWPFAAYTIRVASLFAGLPGASLHLPAFPSGYLFLAYGGLAGIVRAAKVPRAMAAARGAARLGGPVWLILLAAMATLAWKAALDRPDGRLHVMALPGGDILIESPTGRFVALSRAPGQIGLAEGLDQHLPLTHPPLDWLILAQGESSPGAARLALGRHAPPGILALESGGVRAQDEPAADVEIEQASGGSALDLGDGARLQVMEPGRAKLSVLISVGSAEILLTEMDDPRWLAGLARRVPKPTAVILVGEAGSMARILKADWTVWAPRVIVACPIPGEAWRDRQPRSWLTAHGWVELVTDGSKSGGSKPAKAVKRP